jgi:hypothetical protein
MLFVLPAFFIEFPAGDAVFHLPWSNAYAQQFWQGSIYPGWINTLNAGCGGAVMYFYPPLSFIIISVFEPLDFDTTGWTPIVLASLIFVTISTYGSYKLFREYTTSRIPAMLGCMIYVFSTINSALFYSVFLPFFISTTFAPLLLFYALKISRSDKQAIFKYALVLGLILLSNYNGFIMISGMSICYILFNTYQLKADFKKVILYALSAIALGLLLTSFLTLPLYSLLENTSHKEDFYDASFQYYNNFLTFKENTLVEKPLLERVRIIGNYFVYGSLILATILFKLLPSQARRKALFAIVAITFTAILTQEISQPLWEIIPLIQLIQFPVRLLIIIDLCLTIVIVIYLNQVYIQKPLDDFLFQSGILFMLLILAPFASTLEQAFTNKRESIVAWDLYQEHNSAPAPAFTHKDSTNFKLLNTDNTVDGLQRIIKTCETKIRTDKGDSSHITLIKWANKDIEFTTHYKEPTNIIVSQLYFDPLWQAHLNGKALAISPSQNGLISLKIPSGEHHVILSIPRQNLQIYGIWLSTIALGIIFIGLLYYRSKKTASCRI